MNRIGAIFFFGIASCSPTQESHVQKVEGHIRSQMIDPESARFENVEEKRPGLVCGNVNGKNRLGGYTGSQPFVARIDGEKIDVEVLSGPPPQFMTTDFPAEEFGECFPQLIPVFRAILGDSYQPSGS